MKEVKGIIESVKDRDYSYRLARGLRNFTLHQGNVITQSSYTTSEDGSYELRLGVEPRRLADRGDRSHESLLETSGPIPVQQLVQHGYVAAERVVIEAMLALHEDVYDRISGLEKIGREALAGNDAAQARIVYLSRKADGSAGEMTIHDIPTSYRGGFDDFYAQCLRVMRRPVVTVTPEVLMVEGPNSVRG